MLGARRQGHAANNSDAAPYPANHYAKTRVTYADFIVIDTLGEFIEMPFFCRQAINVSCDAGLVGSW